MSVHFKDICELVFFYLECVSSRMKTTHENNVSVAWSLSSCEQHCLYRSVVFFLKLCYLKQSLYFITELSSILSLLVTVVSIAY